MKLVKLNNRHKLYRYGYTHALRFNGYGAESKRIFAIESYLQSAYPGIGLWHASLEHPRTAWAIHWPPKANGVRPYWIGFKKEEDAIMCILIGQ